ncbi:MAG: dehydrogenase [Ignavibacteria bacterium]|nr:dehydrogenase [Ignavibacteria bacterium]
MNILILHAHIEPDSFCSSLKNLAFEHFTANGDTVEISDLYQMGFNPVASRSDFKSVAQEKPFNYLKEQIFAFQNNSFSDEITTEMQKFVRADLLLLNFPLWWSSVPAIMKGWLDKVLALGFSYHPRDKKYETAPFRGKKALCTITAGGSSAAYTSEGENGDIMESLFHLHHGTLYYCGLDVLPPFITWRTHLTDEETLKGYLNDYKIYLENIDFNNKLY